MGNVCWLQCTCDGARALIISFHPSLRLHACPGQRSRGPGSCTGISCCHACPFIFISLHLQAFNDASGIRANGLHVGGVRHIALRCDDRSVYGKKVHPVVRFLFPFSLTLYFLLPLVASSLLNIPHELSTGKQRRGMRKDQAGNHDWRLR